jgi:hypothetical protein
VNAITRRRLLIDCVFVVGGLFAASSLSALNESASPSPSPSATPKVVPTNYPKPGEAVAKPSTSPTPRLRPLPGRMHINKPSK